MTIEPGKVRKPSRKVELISLLRQRETYPVRDYKRLLRKRFEESFNNGCYTQEYFNLNSSVVTSTIALDISSDGEYLASSHGDHTVKIFKYYTGEQIRNFYGHPRTPWTVKFNPKNSHIVASGCLGCEARVWNIDLDICLNMIKYDFSIITMSFHPSGELLAVASGQMMRLWNWKKVNRLSATILSPKAIKSLQDQDRMYKSNDYYTRCIVNERSIRAVAFHPSGDHVFIAAPYMKREEKYVALSSGLTPCRLYCVNYRDLFDDFPKRVIDLQAQPIVLSEMHVYSDGGIDISKDGRYIVVCGMLLCPRETSSMSLSDWGRRSLMTNPIQNQSANSTTVLLSASHSGRLSNQSSFTGNDLSASSLGINQFNSSRIVTLSAQSSMSRDSFALRQETGHSIFLDSDDDSRSSRLATVLANESTSGILPTLARLAGDQLSALSGSFRLFEHVRRYENLSDVNERDFYASHDQEHYSDQSYQPTPITTAIALPIPATSGLVLKEHICVFELTIIREDAHEETVQDLFMDSNDEDFSSSSAYVNSDSSIPVLSASLLSQNVLSSNMTLHQPTSLNTLKSSANINQTNPFISPDRERSHGRAHTPRAVAYDDDLNEDYEFVECNVVSKQEVSIKLTNYRLLTPSLMKAIVSTKFSSTGDCIVLGYGVRNALKEVSDHKNKRVACEILSTSSRELNSVRVLPHSEDEVNVSLFHPLPGYGLVYGTKTGRLRIFRRSDQMCSNELDE